MAAGPGGELHRSRHRRPAEAGEGEDGGPARHRAGVVVAALGLVEGAASRAVVASAHGADDAQALLLHALLHQAHGGHVLEARHRLAEVREGLRRALLRVVGHDERRLVGDGEGAHVVEVRPEHRPHVVAEDAPQRGPRVGGVDERSEAADVGDELADELVHEAAGGELVVGPREVGRAHADEEAGGHVLPALRRHDPVLVVLAVPEVGVDPARAALEEAPALGGEARLPEVARHLLRRAQRAEVPQAHLRVGAVVLDVHRVVLAALHDAVAVGVPPARDPAELDRLPHLRPQPPEEHVVPRELPVPVHLEDAAHLAVGRGPGELLRAPEGQVDAEAHEARVARGVVELHLAHRPRERAEEERRRLLVVPDVGARAVAAAGGVGAALPAVEAAVRGAEAGLGAQGREVEEGRLLHLGGEVAAEEGRDERDRAAVQLAQPGKRLLRRVPRVREAGRVVVAHEVAGARRVGLRSPRVAAGEVPGEEERHLARLAGGEVERHGERGHRHAGGRGGPLVEPAVGEEVVPEVEERPRPAALGPRRPPRRGFSGRGDEGDRAPRGVGGVHLRRVEEEALRGARAAERVAVARRADELRVALPVLPRPRAVHPDEVREREAGGRLERRRRAASELDAEDGDGQAARLRVRGDERAHRLEVRLDGELGVAQKNPAERVRRRERGGPEAGQAGVRSGRAVAALEVLRRQRALEDAGDGGPAGLAQAQSQERCGGADRDEALARPVHDLEVAQFAAAAERDGAGPDPADGQGDAEEVRRVVVAQ